MYGIKQQCKDDNRIGKEKIKTKYIIMDNINVKFMTVEAYLRFAGPGVQHL